MTSNSTTFAIAILGGILGSAIYQRLVSKKSVTSVVTSKASPAGGHYSQAVIANGVVTISGLLPITSSGVKLADKTFKEQTEAVFVNLDAILQAAGSSRSQLINCRVYVSEIDDWTEFNKLYSAWCGDHKPARAVVPVPHLHYGLRLGRFNIFVNSLNTALFTTY